MWHCPQVVGNRATSTEAVWRVWQAVQVTIDPSALGRPTLWQFVHPLWTAGFPSRVVNGLGGRLQPPGWNCSLNATCSGVKSLSPYTAAQDGAACRLRRYYW